jgi:hypothetical protein
VRATSRSNDATKQITDHRARACAPMRRSASAAPPRGRSTQPQRAIDRAVETRDVRVDDGVRAVMDAMLDA